MVLIRLAKFVTAGFLAVVPLAVLPPDAVADPNVAVLAFGLVGSQSVFESEAKGSAAILARQLGAGNVAARANTKTRGDVTIDAIKAAIQSAAAKMDREHDLLALILTSHGSPDGVAVQAGRRVETLSPSALARLLDGTGVRHRIVIISACYSGVFLGPLANDNSLEHFPIRLGVSRVREISFAFFFGNIFEKRGDCSPKFLNSARLHFA